MEEEEKYMNLENRMRATSTTLTDQYDVEHVDSKQSEICVDIQVCA